MGHAARETMTESGLSLPNSFEVAVTCDVGGCMTRVVRHVGGFADAHLAVRHLKGWLIADEGWRAMTTPDKTRQAMTCPEHRKGWS